VTDLQGTREAGRQAGRQGEFYSASVAAKSKIRVVLANCALGCTDSGAAFFVGAPGGPARIRAP